MKSIAIIHPRSEPGRVVSYQALLANDIVSILLGLLTLCFLVMGLFLERVHGGNGGGQAALTLDQVAVGKTLFNPSAGEQAEIGFQLSEGAEVSVKVFDSQQEVITVLCEGTTMEKGAHAVLWDGRDQSGRMVPDEAYFFTIKAVRGEHQAVYDPTAFSGGKLREIEQVRILPSLQQVEYLLPEAGRVFLKAGIVGGPLLAIPVDGQPRPAGLCREHWDGMDQDRLISVQTHPHYQIRADYFTLWENTLLTTGNSSLSYLEYKRAAAVPKSEKAIPPQDEPPSVLTSPLYNLHPFLSNAPQLEVGFPGSEQDEEGCPLLEAGFAIRVDFLDPWKAHLSSRQYEIYFFLDNEFLLEDPRIQLAYARKLKAGRFAKGFHVITVNLISTSGQIAVKSVRVKLQ